MSVGEVRDSAHEATSLDAALGQVPGAEVARVLRDVLRAFENQHGGDSGMTFAAALGCALLEAASEDYDRGTVVPDVRRSAFGAVAAATRARKYHQAFTRRHLTGGHSVVPTLLGYLEEFGPQRGVLTARGGTQVAVAITFTGCEEKAGRARNSPLVFRLGVALVVEDMKRPVSPPMAAAFVRLVTAMAEEKRDSVSATAEMLAGYFVEEVDERMEHYDRDAVTHAARVIASSILDIMAYSMFAASIAGVTYRREDVMEEAENSLTGAVNALTLIACNRGGKPRKEFSMRYAHFAEGIVAALEQQRDELDRARAQNGEDRE